MNRSFVFGKKGEGQFTLNLDGALGCAFGSSFKMERISNKLFKIIQIKENTNMEDIGKSLGCHWLHFSIIHMCGKRRYVILTSFWVLLLYLLWKNVFLFPVKESGEDNRNICDDGRSQKLSPEEISQLKDSGLTGKEVG